MDYSLLFPLFDLNLKSYFINCKSNEDFLKTVIEVYRNNKESRVKEAALSVYMAYRDHYPRYLSCLNPTDIIELDQDIEKNFSRVIKLRRIVLGQLAKVA
jgi:hypothetical protein